MKEVFILQAIGFIEEGHVGGLGRLREIVHQNFMEDGQGLADLFPHFFGGVCSVGLCFQSALPESLGQGSGGGKRFFVLALLCEIVLIRLRKIAFHLHE